MKEEEDEDEDFTLFLRVHLIVFAACIPLLSVEGRGAGELAVASSRCDITRRCVAYPPEMMKRKALIVNAKHGPESQSKPGRFRWPAGRQPPDGAGL
jgi:hypothetical protein